MVKNAVGGNLLLTAKKTAVVWMQQELLLWALIIGSVTPLMLHASVSAKRKSERVLIYYLTLSL